MRDYGLPLIESLTIPFTEQGSIHHLLVQAFARDAVVLDASVLDSSNDSASALYYGEIGAAAGVATYLQRIGITGLNPDPNAWGYSLITPLAMVDMLTLLYEGKILTPSHRSLAFSLMEQVETDQQWGRKYSSGRGRCRDERWLVARP